MEKMYVSPLHRDIAILEGIQNPPREAAKEFHAADRRVTNMIRTMPNKYIEEVRKIPDEKMRGFGLALLAGEQKRRMQAVMNESA